MPHIFAYMLFGLFGLISMALDPAMAAGTEDSTEVDADYTEAKSRIAAEDYASALPLLDQLTTAQPENADAWNLRGYANRKLGNMDVAAASYTTALTLNPGHLGALEYQGEMFVQLGQTDAAKANLKTLQDLCGNCEEAEDLAEAIGTGG